MPNCAKPGCERPASFRTNLCRMHTPSPKKTVDNRELFFSDGSGMELWTVPVGDSGARRWEGSECECGKRMTAAPGCTLKESKQPDGSVRTTLKCKGCERIYVSHE